MNLQIPLLSDSKLHKNMILKLNLIKLGLPQNICQVEPISTKNTTHSAMTVL